MLPPKKHVQQQQQQPQRTAGRLSPWVKEKPLLATANWNVLAERNQQVAPVGAWVEGAEDVEEQEESLAFVSTTKNALPVAGFGFSGGPSFYINI